MNNDTPISRLSDDKLGFGGIARHLADVFLRNDLSDGVVVGIEGAWGSGKSSLANLALDILKSEESPLPIVRFSPWIVGSRSELVRELFLEFDGVYDSLPATSRRTARTLLRRYAQAAPALAEAFDAAGAGIPLAASVSKTLKSTGDRASRIATPPLGTLRQRLREQFRKLPQPLVVFIDDLDRLEPGEAVEILRLVRAVADFPNVAYLLAYDPRNLAKCVERATGVDDGAAYIEKFVQASFKVPAPMSIDLKAWLAAEAQEIAGHTETTRRAAERLRQAVSCWCAEYIATPRDVVRVANALRLYAAPVAERIDLADALFIQIIRIHRPELHNWIERYVTARFAFDASDAHSAWLDSVSERSRDLGSEISSAAGEEDEELDRLVGEIRRHLPELRTSRVFDPRQFGTEERRRYAAERRLWSPSHFRLYFALSIPAGAVSDEEVHSFLDKCAVDRGQAQRLFRELCGSDRPQGGNMAQALISRVLDIAGRISPDRIPGLLVVLSIAGDEFFRRQEQQGGGGPPWPHGGIVEAFRLIGRIDGHERAKTLNEIFGNAASLAWLNAIVTDALTERGSLGSDEKPEGERVLTETEFERLRKTFLERLSQARVEDIQRTPYFLSLMHRWRSAGGMAEVAEWINAQSSAAKDFVDLLGLMTVESRVSSATGIESREYLERETLETFFGPAERVRTRLDAISSNTEHSEELRLEAHRLSVAIGNTAAAR